MAQLVSQDLVLKAKCGDLKGLQDLLSNGGDPNIRDIEGKTPLIMASSSGQVKIVEFLLSKGADCNIRDESGCTALIRASRVGNSVIVELLLSCGADPNIRDNDGKTALDRAKDWRRQEVVQLLETSLSPLETVFSPALQSDSLTHSDGPPAPGVPQPEQSVPLTKPITVERRTSSLDPRDIDVLPQMQNDSVPSPLQTDSRPNTGDKPDFPLTLIEPLESSAEKQVAEFRPAKNPKRNKERTQPAKIIGYVDLKKGPRNGRRIKTSESSTQRSENRGRGLPSPSGYRKKLRNAAQEAIAIVTRFPDLDSVFLPDTDKRVEIQDILRTAKMDIQQAVKQAIDETEWDHINIALYGQTNAGKSTLIEALTGGDGMGIGDGRKDFTKHVRDLNYGNVVLLDLPGIEGNEADVKEEIAKALRKTHVVFFVNGTKREPDKLTLDKIAADLAAEARICSVINARGKPPQYQDVNSLLTEDLQKLEARIVHLLRNRFGRRYQGNFTVQAHLAFLAQGKPISEDLVKDQVKLLRIFPSPSAAFEFSRMATVRKTIDGLAKDGLKAITVANTLKLLEPLETNLDRLYQKWEDLQTIVDNLESEVSRMVSACPEIFEKYNHRIDSMVNQRIEEMKREMTKKVYQGIDEGWPESRIKQEIERIKNSTCAEIDTQLSQRIGEMKNDMDELLQAFKRRLELEFKFSDFSADLPVGEILQKMERDLDCYLREAWDLLKRMFWAITPALFSKGLTAIVVAIAGAVVVIIRKMYDFLFGDPERRKREAKRDAYTKIQDAVSKVRKNIQNDLESQRRQLQTAVTDPINKIEQHQRQLKKFVASFGSSIGELARVVACISGALLGHLAVQSFDKAYIGVKAEQVYIIGNGITRTDEVTARLSDVVTYPSTQKLFEATPHRIENGVVFVDGANDLAFWALTAFAADLGFQSVRRH